MENCQKMEILHPARRRLTRPADNRDPSLEPLVSEPPRKFVQQADRGYRSCHGPDCCLGARTRETVLLVGHQVTLGWEDSRGDRGSLG